MPTRRYLMAERGLSFDEAYQQVKLCRPCIDPNPGAGEWPLASLFDPSVVYCVSVSYFPQASGGNSRCGPR